MSSPPLSPAPARPDPVGRALLAVSRVVAIGGGIVLCAVGALTVASVLGRYFFHAPFHGDFELVELGIAIAVFSFLPYCQMVRGNVIVDFFTANLRPALRCSLDAFGALLFAGVAALLAWRTTHGGLDYHATGEQTVILLIPRVYSFYVIVPCLALLVLACAWSAWRGLLQARGAIPDERAGPETLA